MAAKVNEFRALNARWLNLHEAAFYCGFCVAYFNEKIRDKLREIGSRPVMFDRDEINLAMESLKIGNLPGNRVNPHQQERR